MTLEQFLYKALKLPKKPYALPIRQFNPGNEYTWEDFEEDVKRDHPIKYFFVEKTMDAEVNVFKIYRDIKSFIKRYTTYNRIINIKQPNDPSYYEYDGGYIDACDAITLANFKILENYIKELMNHFKIYDINSLMIELQNEEFNFWCKRNIEALRIYKWWTIRRIELCKRLDGCIGEEYAKNEELIMKEQDENLMKIISIIRDLWI